MDSKKFNIFSMLMVVVMCVVTIFVAINKTDSRDGRDGKSSYELAIENGLIPSTMTELEYLLSLQGSDGGNITVEDLWRTYLQTNNYTESQCTLAMFIETYYPEYLLDVDDASKMTISELAAQQALRSTVDILYSGFMNSAIINAYEAELTSTGEAVWVVEETTSAPVCLSAGAGVIYKMDSDTAYIITNYHVCYVDNYSNDTNYRVYCDEDSGEYFTATYDESKVKTVMQYGRTTRYILQSDVEMAPIETHFMETYEVYLHGYQTEEYALSATFVGGSAENDIAVLKIEKAASANNALIFTEDYKAAAVGDSTAINQGEEVIAVGNPLLANTNIDTSTITTIADYVAAYKETYIDALCLTVTGGEVSNISEYQDFGSILDSSKDSIMRLIRVSSAINAGNSGGGLYDMHGKLIGIVNGKISSANYDNVGYAIPVNKAVAIADKVIAECTGIDGTVQFKSTNVSKIGIEVETSKNGTQKPYYDEGTLSWVNKNSVVIKNMSNSAFYVGGATIGDTLVSIEFGSNTYELANDYELYDTLLMVPEMTGGETIEVKFNFEKSVSGAIVSYSVTITLSADSFEVVV